MQDKLQFLKDAIAKDTLIKALVVLILGLVMMDFLFSLIFGAGGFAQKYLNLVNLVVNLLALIMLGAFFWGLYVLVRENGNQLLRQLNNFSIGSRCAQCGKGLVAGWNCCPFCGRDVNDQRTKN
ncbi:MAG: hypothetical protein ACYDG6_04240 [Thermincolia bacterium]